MSAKVSYEPRQSSYKGRISTVAVVNRGHTDILEFFDDVLTHFKGKVQEFVCTHPNIKVNTVFSATFKKPSVSQEQVTGSGISASDVEREFAERSDRDDGMDDKLDQWMEAVLGRRPRSQLNSDAFECENGELDQLLNAVYDQVFPYEQNHASEQTGEPLEDESDAWLNAAYDQVFGNEQTGGALQGDSGNHLEQITHHVHTKSQLVDKYSNLDTIFNQIKEYTLAEIDDVMLKGSGLTLVSINEMIIQINKFNPLRGRSYIKSPAFLTGKRAIINVENKKDNKCFMWAILAAKFGKTDNHPERTSAYKNYLNEFDFSNLEFPLAVNKIRRFEEQNPTVSVHIYAISTSEDGKKNEIYPLRLSETVKAEHFHLLYLQETVQNGGVNIPDKMKNVQTNGHYCAIKNLSALVKSQITKHCKHMEFCSRCLNGFTDEKKLSEHKTYCENQNTCKITMPIDDKVQNIMKFKNHYKKLQVPFVIYADIETLLKTPTQKFAQTTTTTAYQEHEPYSVGFYFKSAYENVIKSEYKSKRGKDCIQWFILELKSIAEKVKVILNRVEPMQISADEERQFQNSKVCHICETSYTADDVKVRDHSHLTGKYRGSAHSKCNILHRESRTIPVVFHNLSHYDSHFIIQELANDELMKGTLTVIASNSEKYISFTKTVDTEQTDFKTRMRFQFIDSFRFMPSSLDYLASLLPSTEKHILRSEYQSNPQQFQLLERKGVLCYDYIDCWEKLDMTELPSKDHFYSRLIEEHISDRQYNLAQQVWNTFNTRTIGEYSDLYLKTDVLLLADVFEHFRKTCLAVYQLDAAHYFTSPGLSFDAMLRYTGIHIELLTDIDQHMFIENGENRYIT